MIRLAHKHPHTHTTSLQFYQWTVSITINKIYCYEIWYIGNDRLLLYILLLPLFRYCPKIFYFIHIYFRAVWHFIIASIYDITHWPLVLISTFIYNMPNPSNQCPFRLISMGCGIFVCVVLSVLKNK